LRCYPYGLKALIDDLVAVAIQDRVVVFVYYVDVLKRLRVAYAPIKPLVIRFRVSDLSDADCCFLVSRCTTQPVSWVLRTVCICERTVYAKRLTVEEEGHD
jgi:hypothetical protein